MLLFEALALEVRWVAVLLTPLAAVEGEMDHAEVEVKMGLAAVEAEMDFAGVEAKMNLVRVEAGMEALRTLCRKLPRSTDPPGD